MSTPWDGIARPPSGHTWKLRDARAASRVLFGRSAEGKPAFLLEMKADYPDLLMRLPEIRGLRLDHRKFDNPKVYGLIVELRESQDETMFGALCDDLVRAIEPLAEERQAVLTFLNRMAHWQKFLSQDRGRLLSQAEIRGLMGELVVLGHLLDRDPGRAFEIVTGWVGPLGAPQDFQLPGFVVEAKTTGPGGARIHIASEFQLDPAGAPLFLAVVPLEESDFPGAASINSAVRSMQSRLDERTALLFLDRLGAAGYIELAQYDSPTFRAGPPDLYTVTDEFPKLVSATLPQGITGVQYGLDLPEIDRFRIPELPEATP